MNTKIIEYKNIHDAENDMNRKQKQGWVVMSVDIGGQRQSLTKSVAIGIPVGLLTFGLGGPAAGALFGKKRGKVTVTYQYKKADLSESMYQLGRVMRAKDVK